MHNFTEFTQLEANFSLPGISSSLVRQAIRDRGRRIWLLRAIGLRRGLSSSEKVRLAALTALANEIAATEAEAATTWWQTSSAWLSGRTPLDVIVRPNGVAIVEDMRTCIAHGIYS